MPRSAGQTLQTALYHLLPNRGAIWHSPGNSERCWRAIRGGDLGAVEIFAPLEYLNREFPNSLFIWNCRDLDTWWASCKSVYEKSQKQNWNNPLWKYPIDQFPEYYVDATARWIAFRDSHPDQCIEVDLIKYPNWVQLCDGLELPIPVGRPFPRVDRVKSPIRPHAFRGLPNGPMNLLSPTLEFE